MRTIAGRGSDRPSRAENNACRPPRFIGPTRIRLTPSGLLICNRDAGAGSALPERAVTSTPTRPLSRRRAKSSAAWLDVSSHCTSSMATSTGEFAARRSTTDKNAAPRTRSSVAGLSPACSSSLSTATLCIGGRSASSADSISPKRSANTAKLSTTSADPARADTTRNPSRNACSTAASHNVVLPIPGSPSITKPEARCAADVKKSSTAPNSYCVLLTQGSPSKHKCHSDQVPRSIAPACRRTSVEPFCCPDPFGRAPCSQGIVEAANDCAGRCR